MKKCTLSRIKSYEEKHHYKSKKPINIKINFIENMNKDNLNNINNKTDSSNFKIFYNIYDKKDNLIKSERQINSASSYYIKSNFKSNIYNNNLEQNNKNTIFKNNNIIENQKKYLIQKQNIRIINNQFNNNKNYLVSTGNTSGDIDIGHNEDINEFNSDEKESILNGHIPSLSNILFFPKYFGKAKKIKENKKINYIKNLKINECNENDLENTKEKEHQNFSTNNYKNKYLKHLNFDQPNKNIKNIISKINTNIESDKNNKRNSDDIKQISSYNNLKKVDNNMMKKLTYRNIIKSNKKNSSYCFSIKKMSGNKINIKKELSFSGIKKKLVFSPAKQNKTDKINKLFQREESQNNKNKYYINKNYPTIFIKNSVLKDNDSKNPLRKHNQKIINIADSKEKKDLSSKQLEAKKLNIKQIIKPKIKKIININLNNLNEKMDKNIPNKARYNSQKKNLICTTKNKLQNISKSLYSNYPITTIKKNSTQINNHNNNINYSKRIIKRVNKTKIIEHLGEKEVFNLINFKKNINKISNNQIENNKNKKVIKVVNESMIINYSNTYTNTNYESNLLFKNDINNSESDTDKEDNSNEKKKYLPHINKNFVNAKKILNKTMKFKENQKKITVPKKINSCNNNKIFMEKKRTKYKINMKMIYLTFKKYDIDKKSIINLSLVNKNSYKITRAIIFRFYYYKIIKEKECEKSKINLLKNTFSYSSPDLKLKNKREIIRLYNYYSKEIKSNYKYEILQDISRTFPNDINFNTDIKNKLYYLLICYSNFNKTIGYAQGLNFVAASCLYFFTNEEDAFIFLDSFINKFELYNLLGVDNKILIQKIKYFEILLNKYIPDLNKYLNSKLLNHEFFSAGWIISVFSNNMDKNKLLICWCFMIVFGWKFFYSFIIQVLIKYKDSIINSAEKHLSDKMRNILSNEQFIKDFNYIIKNTFNFMLEHIIL